MGFWWSGRELAANTTVRVYANQHFVPVPRVYGGGLWVHGGEAGVICG